MRALIALPLILPLALALSAAAATAAPAPIPTPVPTPVPRDGAGCDGNTLQIDACLGDALARVEAEHQRYLAAARARVRKDVAAAGPNDPSTMKAAAEDLDRAEAAWQAYRDAECKAVFDDWSQGTIRVSMEIGCRLRLTRLRTHTIWADWLTAMDRSPPMLPEPPVPPLR